MNDSLGPEAQSLLETTRDADLPSAEDRARVRARLALQLAGAATTSAAAKVAAQGAVGSKLGASTLAGKALLTVAVVGAVGAGAHLALRAPQTAAPGTPRSTPAEVWHAPRPTEPHATASPATVQSVEAPRVAGHDESPAPTPAPVAPVMAHGSGARQAVAAHAAEHDWAADLRAEVALLSLAQQALAAGDTELALAHLAQHRARFPRGALSQERLAATAIAHCQAGRVTRGRALLAELPGDSPLSARAADACHGAAR